MFGSFGRHLGTGLDVDGPQIFFSESEHYQNMFYMFFQHDKQLLKDITRFCNISLSAGCANLDVVDLPEKCSMLHEPPFKIEETVATRRTLGNVGIRLILMRTAGWLENEVL